MELFLFNESAMDVEIKGIDRLSDTFEDLEVIGYITYSLRNNAKELYYADKTIETCPHVHLIYRDTDVLFVLVAVRFDKDEITLVYDFDTTAE